MNVVEMRRESTEQKIEKIDQDIARLDMEIQQIEDEGDISKNPIRTENQSNLMARKLTEKIDKTKAKDKLIFLESSKNKLTEIQPEIDTAIGTDSIKEYKLALQTIFKLTNELRNDAILYDEKALLKRLDMIEDFVKNNGKVSKSA